ncbi:hypothetical protein HAX54_024953, partial [Datura stramonium]|nr:hypothetical protein [Datura stramonium]
MSYFELRGYIKELKYPTTCKLSTKPPNSDNLVDIVDDMDILDMCYFFENGDTVEVAKDIGEDTLNGEEPFTTTPATTFAATRASSTTSPVIKSGTTAHGTISGPANANGDGPDPANADSDGLDLGLAGSDFIDEEGSNYSTDDNVEFEGGLVGDKEEDYSSNAHEEVRELRAEKRTFQRRKRNESTS